MVKVIFYVCANVSDSNMSINIEEQDNIIVAKLKGDVDLAHAPGIRKILLKTLEGKKPLVIDLSDVSYIDSSGIACLVEALQSAKKHKLDFSLAHISSKAMRVLQLARLDKVFTIYASLEEAINEGK